jgi:two-component system LytT family sensor kinase
LIEPGIIKLTTGLANGNVYIDIEDNAGACGAWNSNGLGMKIVEKRIKNLYGEQCGLDVHCVPNECTRIRLILPERRAFGDTCVGH